MVPVAVGANTGWASMVKTVCDHLEVCYASVGVREPTRILPMTSLDNACRERRLRPTLLKIDVEGYEDQVLAGARETLQEYRPVLFLEVHRDLMLRRGVAPEVPLQTLYRAGYHFQSSDGKSVAIEVILANPITRVVARCGLPS